MCFAIVHVIRGILHVYSNKKNKVLASKDSKTAKQNPYLNFVWSCVSNVKTFAGMGCVYLCIFDVVPSYLKFIPGANNH